MRRNVAGILLSLPFLCNASSQSLGELARQQQARRAAQSEPKAQRVYTNDDLKQSSNPPGNNSLPASVPTSGQRLFPWKDDARVALKSVEEAKRVDKTRLAETVLSWRD